jgi:tRNA modification GTPase
VEIGCHGGRMIYSQIIGLLVKKGAEYAEPGEFTKRAFLNGKLDLTQVEAVADLIHSLSVPGSQTAARQLSGEFTKRLNDLRQQLLDISGLLELELDFSEEDLEFVEREKIINKITETRDFCKTLANSFSSAEILRSGYYVGIAGFPNSGKSTLFNSLLEHKRAIVSHIPGTTRDYLEETIVLDGIPVKIIDTAGIREATDIIEIEGIKLVESVLEQSNMILVLNDVTEGFDHSNELVDSLKEKFPDTHILLVQNKIDLREEPADIHGDLTISAIYGTNLDKMKQIIAEDAHESTDRISDVLINARHSRLLNQVIEALNTALEGLENDMENEIVAIDIRKATKILGEITGEEWNEEVLANIFSRFCIGK